MLGKYCCTKYDMIESLSNEIYTGKNVEFSF